jgi:hypothetical protein
MDLALFASLFAVIVYRHSEPEQLVLLKDRYRKLRENLGTDERWKKLVRPSIITGQLRPIGPIGSNVNKGYEIYVCLQDDDVNSAMNVLLHELAHTTVTEYDHSSAFWQNFKDLKALAASVGVYQNVGTHTYCGETIQD